jgi:hypothetical protein
MTVLTKTLILIAVFGVSSARVTASSGCSEDLPLYSRLLTLISDQSSRCEDSTDEFREVDADYWEAPSGDREFREGLTKLPSIETNSVVKKRQEITVGGQVANESDLDTTDVLKGYRNVRH